MNYQDELRVTQKSFTETITEEMRVKGLAMQELLLKRIEINEAHVIDFEARLKDNEREIQLMSARIR